MIESRADDDEQLLHGHSFEDNCNEPIAIAKRNFRRQLLLCLVANPILVPLDLRDETLSV
jgi:hypothetical protein